MVESTRKVGRTAFTARAAISEEGDICAVKKGGGGEFDLSAVNVRTFRLNDRVTQVDLNSFAVRNYPDRSAKLSWVSYEVLRSRLALAASIAIATSRADHRTRRPSRMGVRVSVRSFTRRRNVSSDAPNWLAAVAVEIR